MNVDTTSVLALCQALNERATLQGCEGQRSQRQRKLEELAELTAASPGFIPSGPRKRGEGCDDDDQGILSAESTRSGGARLCITLLAAGFIIGPGGASVRAVSQKTGADVRSWSDTCQVQGRQRRVRIVVIEGSGDAVVLALAIISEAVERYKELCEGRFCGQCVERCQPIHGVHFWYSPPPRGAVPYAASIREGAQAPPQSRSPHGQAPMGLRGSRQAAAGSSAIGGKENSPGTIPARPRPAEGTPPAAGRTRQLPLGAATGAAPPQVLRENLLRVNCPPNCAPPVPAVPAAPLLSENAWERGPLSRRVVGPAEAPAAPPGAGQCLNPGAQSWDSFGVLASPVAQTPPTQRHTHWAGQEEAQQYAMHVGNAQSYSLFGAAPSLFDWDFLARQNPPPPSHPPYPTNLSTAAPPFLPARETAPQPPPPAHAPPQPLHGSWPLANLSAADLQACGLPTFTAFAEKAPLFRHPTFFAPPPYHPPRHES